MSREMEWYMENGNKIDKISPDIFLPDEYKIDDVRPELYNLEDEFSKTKKNRDIIPFLILFFFVAVLISLSFLLIYYLQNKNKKMSVDIEDFQDLNLLEILNTVKGYEKDLLALKDEVTELEKLRDLLIKDIKDDITKKINFIKHKKISQKDKNEKTKELKDEERERIKKVNEEYNSQIAAKKEKIEEISTKLKSFEESTLRSIKESNIVLDENSDAEDIQIKKISEKYERKLREETDFYKKKLERTESYYKNLTDTLILKYNPVITEPKIKELIEVTTDENFGFNFKIKEDDPYLNSFLIDMRKMQNDLLLLEKEFEDIPYENSVPLLIKKISYLQKKIMNIYEEIAYNLLIQKYNLEKENEENIKKSKGYYNAFLYLVNKDPNYGYIIDPSNHNDVLFIKNESKTINPNDTKTIVRDGSEIGKIQFFVDNNNLKAKIINVKENQKIMPFDRIDLR